MYIVLPLRCLCCRLCYYLSVASAITSAITSLTPTSAKPLNCLIKRRALQLVLCLFSVSLNPKALSCTYFCPLPLPPSSSYTTINVRRPLLLYVSKYAAVISSAKLRYCTREQRAP
jgi:hypothetical protein